MGSDKAEGAKASAAINTVQLLSNAFGSALAGVLVNLGAPSTLASARNLVFVFAAVAVLGTLTSWRAARREPAGSIPVPAVEPANA